MIVKKYIIKTLDDLDRLYNTSPTIFEATYYSKLAVIESCGWLEVSMDLIAKSYIKRKLRTQTFKDIFESSIRKPIHGFLYEDHFRKMLVSTIGISQMEKIEIKCNRTGQIDILKATLRAMITDRNDASHTYIDATKSYPAPSLTKGQIQTIYPILKQIHNEIKKL